MTTAAPLEFFIPGVAAERLRVEMIRRPVPTSTTAAPDASTRFSYRFVYRLSKQGAEYRCRITAAPMMVVVLLGQLHWVARHAEAEADVRLLAACAAATKAASRALGGIGR